MPTSARGWRRFVLQAFQPRRRAGRGVPEDALESLTPREREVLPQLARGYPYKRIGARLGIQRAHGRVARGRGAAQAAAQLAPRGQPLRRRRGLIDDGDGEGAA